MCAHRVHTSQIVRPAAEMCAPGSECTLNFEHCRPTFFSRYLNAHALLDSYLSHSPIFWQALYDNPLFFHSLHGLQAKPHHHVEDALYSFNVVLEQWHLGK